MQIRSAREGIDATSSTSQVARDRPRSPVRHAGARITTTLLNNLQIHDKTFNLETMCVGGGQGMAMVTSARVSEAPRVR